MIYKNITQTIGNTPVVKLNNLVDENMADVYVKLEMFNPGGSVKDRISISMIEEAEKKGLIKPGDTIVEPTSGNTGIGLGLVAASKGYKLVLTMPESMSLERRKLLKAYGAELELTKAHLGMKGAIDKANELVEENGYVMLQQFNNLANPEIHRNTTAKEILNDFGNDLDAFVVGIGTGGTITGVGEVLKKKIDKITVVAVEPEDSPVLSGGNPGPHMIQGIGAGFVPEVLNVKIFDEVIKVQNEEALETARQLAKQEGLMVGISSGAAVFAAIKVAQKLGKGKKVLTIAPDTGERYISTALFE
ncbi:cysteine synthase A [Alkaliphilus metalliredigens QYMF]|uniref:Cysteine synthase n=1 Tax=Alkaliphilus metalliredigens (strain QYMF) TaxID=293826 RepID=A6TJD1_ALKMQ|nr:cysteine synthase A [Alkaliphilus metalliredigens]ABR46299.1 cysteine synthase A [Alkaliphilus metalliredigens QYMF]